VAEVHGSCDDRFDAVRQALASHLDGEELGASIAVDLDGETVVDLWGGWRDEARTRPWTRDTIVTIWSTTKPVVALAALMLVERGELDLYAPVADYWPEFAANGKKDVEVRHLLSHTSGVSGWEQPFTVRDLYDWPAACERLAAQRPWWEPGTASGYHAKNYGHLVGEVVRRITNTTFQRFVADEIAGPLDADFQIGARERDWHRVADLQAPPPDDEDLTGLDPRHPRVLTALGPRVPVEVAGSPEWRLADIGALNGHSNARGVLDVLKCMSLDGGSLLSPETARLAFDQQSDGVDLVLGEPFRFGNGFCLGSPVAPFVPEGALFWHGWGGSMIVMDPARRLTISYVMNRMGGGPRGNERTEVYVRAAYAAVA
jgi:CubicO group peptidase (beta-lactamase class C family)